MIVDLLRRSPLFANLTEEHLAAIAQICQTQTYQPGTYIFKEGDPGNRLFIIAEGEVRISRQIPIAGEEALAILKPGAVFGEMSVFDRSERSTDAIVNAPLTLVSIGRAELELLLEFNPDLGFALLKAVVKQLSGRLRSANDQVRSILAMSMF